MSNDNDTKELYSQVGRLTGRMDAMETRQMLWEQKIEKRLSEIEKLITDLRKFISEGQGAWKLLCVAGYLIMGFFTMWPTIQHWLMK